MTTTRPPSAGGLDWSLGEYEQTAAQLLPAARLVVDRAAPGEGERVVDVGCGTGSAALLAAASGARVTGVDPAARLLEVARARAAAEGLDLTFDIGEAAALPLEDGCADVVMSVFGVIFAPNASAAVAEMARVSAPAGRVGLTAWLPEGAISDVMRVGREAIREAIGGPVAPPPFAWQHRDALAGLFARHGFEVAVEVERLAFTGSSPRDYLEAQSASHPLALAANALLEPRGLAQGLRERTLAIYEAANEDPQGFRVTSRYAVAMARRP